MTELRFSVYKHKLEYGGKLINKNFVVLKDQDNLIHAWTNIANYLTSNKKIKKIDDSNLSRCRTIAMLLNYLLFEKKCINSLEDIKPEYIRNFLLDYSNKNLENDSKEIKRRKGTVTLRTYHVFDFIKSLSKEKIISEKIDKEFFNEKRVYDKKTGRFVNRINPCFDICYIDEDKQIFRDMPQSVMEILMSHVIKKHKDVLMLFALCIFCGLRPSEACNVRREDSKLGKSIYFEFNGDEVIKIRIDLTKEINLRSDLVSVGKIKKERMQTVCPAFIEPFCKCYEIYMKYIEGKKYESEYGPLTIDSRGKAFTYNNFYKRFQIIINEIIPELLSSDDPEVVNYGQLLQETKVSPHILRHYFSCKLAVMGCSLPELMSYRGDTSPESSLQYLLNKSDLEKQLKEVNSKSLEFNLWKISKKK